MNDSLSLLAGSIDNHTNKQQQKSKTKKTKLNVINVANNNNNNNNFCTYTEQCLYITRGLPAPNKLIAGG